MKSNAWLLNDDEERFSVFCGGTRHVLNCPVFFRGEKNALVLSFLRRIFEERRSAKIRIAGYFRGTNEVDDETMRKRLR